MFEVCFHIYNNIQNYLAEMVQVTLIAVTMGNKRTELVTVGTWVPSLCAGYTRVLRYHNVTVPPPSPQNGVPDIMRGRHSEIRGITIKADCCCIIFPSVCNLS
jgi:hypothetical protein